MIGIIIAMEKEAKELLASMKNCMKQHKFGRDYFEGEICNKNIVLVISGIGKVNAAVATQNLISEFNCSPILNIGTCGGLNPTIKIGECYEAKRCYQQDFDLSEIDDVEIGYMQDFDFKFFDVNTINQQNSMTLATTDSFYINKNSIKSFINNGADLRDMEGCSVAQVCNLNNTPCYIQKIVTDVSFTDDIKKQYSKNVLESPKAILENCKKFINSIS